MNPILIALAISVALNVAGGWAYLSQRDETVAAEKDRDQARADASACSDATEALRAIADKREAENKILRKQAADRAKSLNEEADAILSTGPSDPDDCKAASQRLDRWLKGRTK